MICDLKFLTIHQDPHSCQSNRRRFYTDYVTKQEGSEGEMDDWESSTCTSTRTVDPLILDANEIESIRDGFKQAIINNNESLVMYLHKNSESFYFIQFTNIHYLNPECIQYQMQYLSRNTIYFFEDSKSDSDYQSLFTFID